MKLRGGYNVLLAGRPDSAIEALPEPEKLYLPLRTSRFTFSDIRVAHGQTVRPGEALARDPGSYSVPLLAPRAGTVRLDAIEGHILIENVTRTTEEPYHPRQDDPHVPRGMGSMGMKRYKLLELGAWEFFGDAFTGELPDPFGVPQAVIVSTLRLEPFAARGDVQLRKRLANFTRGLEHLQSLLEYQPIYLVLPDIKSEFARQVRETLRGYAWVKLVQIPLRYAFDHFTILARRLGLRRGEPIWSLRTEGVLAVDRALTLERPCTVRIVSLGGPAVASPVHLKAMAGYPLGAFTDRRLADGPVRVINGGILTGTAIDADQRGLDSECTGLTVLAEQEERELLGFVRPGADRRSYSNCFLSALRPSRPERLTTALRGEGRPCVACGFCEEVCPARIMPHLIHKSLYVDDLEAADQLRVDLCVRCGLCSYVCPSKLELAGEFITAQDAIAAEHAEAAAEAQAKAEAEAKAQAQQEGGQ